MTPFRKALHGTRRQAWIVSLLFSAGLLVALFYNVDRQTLLDLAGRIEPEWLPVAAVAYFLTFWTRGVRYKALLQGGTDNSGAQYLHLSLMHHFYLMILPAKAGELVFPWLAHAVLGSGRTLNLLVLLIVRLFDLFFIFVFVAWGLFAALIPDAPATAFWAVTVLAAMLLLLGVRYELVIAALARVLGGLSRQRFLASFFARLHSRLLEAAALLRQRSDAGKQFSLFMWTVASWVVSALGLFSLFRLFGFAPAPGLIIFLLGGLNLVGLLGFFSVGGLGIMELGLAGLLILVGYVCTLYSADRRFAK